METTMKRLCALMASFALALGLAFALTACGPSDEEQIKEAIDAELGVVVEPTDEELDKLVEEIDSAGLSSQLKSFDIDAKTLVSSWIDGFAYEIGDITVDGDTASAKVNVTCKPLYTVMEDWGESFQKDAQSKGFTSTDEIYAYAGKSIMSAIDSAEPVTTETTFELEKDGGSWVLSDNTASQNALIVAMVGAGAL